MTKTKLRYLVPVLVAALVFAVFPSKTANAYARPVDHGVFGDRGNNCRYTVYDNGLLDLNGSGGTGNFDEEFPCPWEDYKNDITNVSIDGYYTSIGDNIFAGLCNVEEIVLPSSAQTVGNNVFAGCTNLKRVVFPYRTTSLGSGLFDVNNKIEKIVCSEKDYYRYMYSAFENVNINKFSFYYSVDYEYDENGVFMGEIYCYAGQNMRFDIFPDDGYEVDKLTLTYGQGKVVEVKPDEDGNYVFHGMPDVGKNDPNPVFRCTFKYNINIDAQPKNYVGQAGKTAKFSVAARGEELTYQWQLKKGKTWADQSSGGATTDTFSVKAEDSRNGKVYRCVITDKYGHSIISDEVSITIKEPSINISHQPSDCAALVGTTAKFSVAAEGEGLTYQWQLKKGNSWANQSSGGATTPTFSVKADLSRNGKVYRCLITNSDGEELATVPVTLTVKEPSDAIKINSQPKSYVGAAGINAVFKVVAEGEGLTYQWQLKKGNSWANQSSGGATTNTFTVMADASRVGKVYRCLITNSEGDMIVTDEVTITIKDPEIAIITQPEDQYAVVGDKVKFSIEAEGEGLTYQWQLKKGKSWSDLLSGGATTDTMTIKVDSGKIGKTYRCVITNAAGEQIATEEVTIYEIMIRSVQPVAPNNSVKANEPAQTEVPEEAEQPAEVTEPASAQAPAEAPAEAAEPAAAEEPAVQAVAAD